MTLLGGRLEGTSESRINQCLAFALVFISQACFNTNRWECPSMMEHCFYMNVQHELVFFACRHNHKVIKPRKSVNVYLTLQKAHLLVKYLTGHAEVMALADKIIQLLPPLQHAVYGLVQNDFCLIQVLLNLRQLVGLRWVLQMLEGLGDYLG